MFETTSFETIHKINDFNRYKKHFNLSIVGVRFMIQLSIVLI